MTAAVFSAVLGIPFWPGTNHHWDSNLFFLGTLGCLALWQSRSRSRFALLAGVAAAATSGFMINKGTLALVVALVVVWRSQTHARYRAAISVLIGCGAAVAAACMVFLANGALADFVYINLVFPATRYESTGRVPYAFYFFDVAWARPLSVFTQVIPSLAATLVVGVLAVPLAALAALPVFALVVVASRAHSGRGGWSKEQALLWIGGAALWISEAHRWDVFHLMYGSPLILASVVGETLANGNGRGWRSRAVGTLTACTVALGIWQGAIGLAAQVPQETRRGAVRAYARDEALQFLLDNTTPRDFVFVYPYYPMYYFLADLRNPTRYGILLYGYNTTGQFQEALADLDRQRPRFVLWDTLVDGDTWKRWYPAYVQPPERDLIIEPYLTRHYTTIATKSGFRIMQRVDD
jgi:hypothetical protein